jgi:hypothetical protein
LAACSSAGLRPSHEVPRRAVIVAAVIAAVLTLPIAECVSWSNDPKQRGPAQKWGRFSIGTKVVKLLRDEIQL